MRKISGVLPVVFLAAVVLVNPTFVQGDEFRFTVVDSSPTSWVARGYSDYTVTPDDGWFFSTGGSFGGPLTFALNGPPLPGTPVDLWRMTFAAPDGEPIVPGLYEDFQRYPFNDPDRPGLSFLSTGRGDNTASGFFEVLEVTYAGTTGSVLSFAADFTHYGETNPDNWAIVEFRYNASAVPEPTSCFGIALAASAVIIRRRRSAGN